MSEETDWAEETERRLLEAALPLAGRLGWSLRLVRAAGAELGLSAADVELLLPDGPRDLAAFHARRLDGQALAALAGVDPASLKIRERIHAGVQAWLRAATADEAAARRWSGFLALPSHIPLGLRLAWGSADVLWRWAGDAATDENHYSKRVLLAEILITSLAIALAAGPGAAERHLQGRIASVMAFERWKSRLPKPADLAVHGAAFLGRLRYGAPPSSAASAAVKDPGG